MPTPPAGSRQGFSLVEVMVAVTLLGVAMMSLAGAAALGLSQMGKAQQDLQYSADVQQVTDSLVGAGWNKVANGSASLRGRPVSWTVNPEPLLERQRQHKVSLQTQPCSQAMSAQ